LAEVTASSRKGFDDAVRMAVERAHRTIDHVSAARVIEHCVVVRRGSITEYRVVIAVSVDALVSVDPARTIVEFNRGAEVMFGYRRDEALGRPLEMLIPERYRGTHDGNVRAFMASEAKERMMGERDRIVGLRKDGSEFPAEASIARRTVDGQDRYSVLLRDVPES
jgi:PAS domain S-box-containing protein